jgi:hypothetical protein
MKILICGDRNWDNSFRMAEALKKILEGRDVDLVIEGEARGADTQGEIWARSKGIEVSAHPADWGQYGRAAGPIRNREMLKDKPDMVIAFHNHIAQSKGTKDMLKASMRENIECYLVTDSEIKRVLITTL